MGSVYDINTGKLIDKTDNIERPFLYQIQQLILREERIYVVHGPTFHLKMRHMLQDIDNMGVPRVYESALVEQVLILSGTPDEWEELMNG